MAGDRESADVGGGDWCPRKRERKRVVRWMARGMTINLVDWFNAALTERSSLDLPDVDVVDVAVWRSLQSFLRRPRWLVSTDRRARDYWRECVPKYAVSDSAAM